ncbi:MAG: DUF1080 domain-containing protein [Isosphaeraceae bacterium]
MNARRSIRLTPALAVLIGLALGGVSTTRADGENPYGPIDGVKLARAEDGVDAPSVPPPADAKVLFDGSNLDAWVGVDGKSPAGWQLVPGRAMQVKGGGIKTREAFDGHVRLHVEFRVPYMPKARGQARGNSGVYLQGRYEVQVLDSYGLDSKDNDCGGIYEVAKPAVNACKAPTVWQAYDIDFRAPVFQDGKKVKPARITVVHNGVTIHKDVEIPVDNTRAGLGGDPSKPGPIMLQDHGNPVQFRNVWVVRLPD